MGIPVDSPAIRQAIEKGLIPADVVKPVAKVGVKRKPRTVALDRRARWAVLLYPACRVVTETNTHEKWQVKAARVKAQREAVYKAWYFSPLCGPESWGHLTRVRVTLTHIGPRMDDDNLASAFKAVRDEVAAQIGTDDGDAFYEWKYQQRRGEVGIEVRIEGTI